MPGLAEPAPLEAGVVDDNAPPLEEIGEYNQSARRGGLVKDQDRDVLAVRDLDGAHPVGRADSPVVSMSSARNRLRGKSASRSSSVAGRSASKSGRTQPTFP